MSRRIVIATLLAVLTPLFGGCEYLDAAAVELDVAKAGTMEFENSAFPIQGMLSCAIRNDKVSCHGTTARGRNVLLTGTPWIGEKKSTGVPGAWFGRVDDEKVFYSECLGCAAH